jgi:mono/diheme cytochrome c family protein
MTFNPKFPLRSVLPALLLVGISHAEPVIPGLHGKHPLDDRQRGELLIGELRCAACHDGMPDGQMKEAPTLADAGSRLTPEFMERFIADPAAVHHGTTMPGLLGAEPEEKRRQVAADITAYLSSLTGAAPEQPTGEVDPYDGKELFHSVGCVACHSPRDEAIREVIRDGVISLTHLPGKHHPGALAAFLHEPLKTRPSGRMPDMKLSKQEAAVIAAYLEGENKPTPSPAPPAADRIAAGKRAFQAYNCTACHQPEKEALAGSGGPSLGNANPTRGCLSDEPGAAPDFKLSTAQKEWIRKALVKPAAEPTPDERIKTHLTRLNCIACHVRDDFGGVSPDLDSFFHSTEESLGNESRIPPPLNLVGAKLRPEWLNKVLYDGEAVRPYMTTRMPQYGTRGLADLAALFAEVDKMEPIELAPPGREEQPQMRDGAHTLLGDQGLNCIACHNYNGKESPGMKGLDLMTSYQRLQPAWFNEFMRNPAKFRPGIIMPSYWPDGKALQTEILDGDTDRQLRALWDNFSLGRSARDPSGLRSEPSVLKVTDTAVTYRGRSNVAGYRGIAVGFPGGMNYAFNAEYGSLSGIWQGDFVRVGWQGQGSGNFDPLGKHLQLSQDVAFLRGAEPPAVWPARPVTTKEQPVNPDPLYPRNHGYAFRGYSLDNTTQVPTFQYRCGEIAIEDHVQSESKTLNRTFTFNAPQEDTVWFRALTGKIETESPTVFKSADLKITLSSGTALLRPAANGEMELLVKLVLPKGTSNTLIQYELLR